MHSGWEVDTGVGCENNEQSFCKTFIWFELIPNADVEDAGEGTRLIVEGEIKPHDVLDKSLDWLELDDEAQGFVAIFGFEIWPGFIVFTVVEVGTGLYGRLDDEGQGLGSKCGVENVDVTSVIDVEVLAKEDDKSFIRIFTRDWL